MTFLILCGFLVLLSIKTHNYFVKYALKLLKACEQKNQELSFASVKLILHEFTFKNSRLG